MRKAGKSQFFDIMRKNKKAPASLQVPCFFDSQRDFSVDGVKGAGKPGVDFLFTSILPQKGTSDEPFGAANSYERYLLGGRVGDVGKNRGVGWNLMPCPRRQRAANIPLVPGTRIPPASLRSRSRGWKPFARLRVRIRHRSGRCLRIAGQSPRRNSRAYHASHW